MSWRRSFGFAARAAAVIFAFFTAMIGQGFTGAIEADAGALDQLSWMAIGMALFAGLFFAPDAAASGKLARVLVGVAMVPATIVMFRIFVDVMPRGPGLALVFGFGLTMHLIAYFALATGHAAKREDRQAETGTQL